MTDTEKILEKFDEGETSSDKLKEILQNFFMDVDTEARIGSDTANAIIGIYEKKISDLFSTSINQARAEEMARVVDNIRFIYDNYFLDQKIQTSGNPKTVINREMFINLLASLEKPVTNKD